MTAERILVDTNVLVYAYDRSQPEKQKRALVVLDAIVQAEVGVLCAQVLSEFFNTITRKIAAPLSVAEAYERLKNYVAAWTVLDLTDLIILEAARGVRDHQFSFWDAQIWASARLNQIPVILSEDFQSGRIIEGIRFVNPFVPEFDIKTVIE
jgi:predicted nucleic acid-binding protein